MIDPHTPDAANPSVADHRLPQLPMLPTPKRKGETWPMHSRLLFLFITVWIFSGSDVLGSGFDGPDGETNATPQLTRIFPEDDSKQQFAGCIQASPLMVWSQREPFVFVAASDGLLAGVQPKTGQRAWEIRLPVPEDYRPWLLATPVQFQNKLVVAYQVRALHSHERVGHRVVVVDLEQRRLDPDFPGVELQAQKTSSDGTEVVRFNPPTSLSRSALVHAPGVGTHPGYVYVSFGNFADVNPWHGWVFELDLKAWRDQGAQAAISGVLLTTPEMSCLPEGTSGSRHAICGGGVWAPAGPQVYRVGDSFELLVPTGNGRLDPLRHAYANTLMRVDPGLTFESGCDAQLCDGFDPSEPAPACLESCKDIFIPRLPAGEEFRPASGVCDDKTFWECLTWLDYDLGANAPVKVAVPNGPTVYVQPGKDGSVYLIDAEHMGTLYDREHLVEVCGTPEDACRVDWAGMIVTQPALTTVDGVPVVIIPTFMPDATHSAGLVALKIFLADGKPRFAPFWRAPDFSSRESRVRFRYPPTRVVVAPFETGEEYAWVGDTNVILGVRVRDGHIVERQQMLGWRSRNLLPLIHDNTLYVPSCKLDDGPSLLEAYAIGR